MITSILFLFYLVENICHVGMPCPLIHNFQPVYMWVSECESRFFFMHKNCSSLFFNRKWSKALHMKKKSVLLFSHTFIQMVAIFCLFFLVIQKIIIRQYYATILCKYYDKKIENKFFFLVIRIFLFIRGAITCAVRIKCYIIFFIMQQLHLERRRNKKTWSVTQCHFLRRKLEK